MHIKLTAQSDETHRKFVWTRQVRSDYQLHLSVRFSSYWCMEKRLTGTDSPVTPKTEFSQFKRNKNSVQSSWWDGCDTETGEAEAGPEFDLQTNISLSASGSMFCERVSAVLYSGVSLSHYLFCVQVLWLARRSPDGVHEGRALKQILKGPAGCSSPWTEHSLCTGSPSALQYQKALLAALC